MKARFYFLFALTLAVPVSAYAATGNEGPIGMPSPAPMPPSNPPPLLAEVERSGGMMPPMPCFPLRTGIRIYEGGIVESFADRNSVRILTLAPEVTERLKAEILSLEAAPLRDINEGEPMCMDAPSTTYSVFQHGSRIEIAARYSCHDHLMGNWQGQELKRALDALLELRNYSGPATGCPMN